MSRVPKSPPPFSERQVVPSILEAKFDTHVPQEAAGGVSERVQSEEERSGELAMKIQNDTDQFVVNTGKSNMLDQAGEFLGTAKASKGVNAFQYSPTKDDSLTSKFTSNLQEQINSLAKNDKQRKQLTEAYGQIKASVDRQTQLHVAGQMTSAEGAAQTDTIKQIHDYVDGYYNDPTMRAQMEKNLDDAVDQHANWRGVPDTDGGQKAAQRAIQQQMVTSAYIAHGDIKGAASYIKELHDDGKLTDNNQFLRLQSRVDRANNEQTGVEFYKAAASLRKDPNGYPDINNIVSVIRNNENLSPEQKTAFEKTAFIEYHRDRAEVSADHAGRMTSFENVISKNPNSQDILNAADKYSWNGASRDAMLKKAASPNHGDLILNFGGKKPNPEVIFNNVYNGIIRGDIDQEKLDRIYTAPGSAMDRNSHDSLTKTITSITKQGVSASKKQFSVQVGEELNSAYGSNVDAKNQFMADFGKAFPDQDSKVEDMRKWVDDRLKPTLKDPGAFWGKLKQEDTLGTGEAHQTIRALMGTQTVDAVTDYLKSKNPNAGADDVMNYFTKGLGIGIDDMAVGQPANNAINSIIDWNRAHPTKKQEISPENVQVILNNFPDGYYY